MKKTSKPVTALAKLLPEVDVDPVHLERNLLQIGYFGCQGTRSQQSIRTHKRVVRRGGQDVTLIAQFESTPRLGLPSIADQDKFLAFLKIAHDQRRRMGHLVNPIRFKGERMLRELGLSDSGENYEAITLWCERMKTTTITSRMVIYMAAAKRYADRAISVFRSFERKGEKGRNYRLEEYEVNLEDWVLENLNSSYVIAQDFNTYKQLSRPTAKGLYTQLHRWFEGSRGRVVEVDYHTTSDLLNLKTYTTPSKIKDFIGKSLDELMEAGYLSKWDIQPRVTMSGYNLVLWPGNVILRMLNLESKGALEAAPNRQLTAGKGNRVAAVVELTPSQEETFALLQSKGVAAAKARKIAQSHDAAEIAELAAYVDMLAHPRNMGKVRNPPALLIYLIESGSQIPQNMVAAPRRVDAIKSNSRRPQPEQVLQPDLDHYNRWCEAQINDWMGANYPGRELDKKVREVVEMRARADQKFAKQRADVQNQLAMMILQREISETLALPSCEEWCKANKQYALFGD